MEKKIYAIVLAGGTGTRMGGDIPKQYLEIDGKPVISYCVEALTVNPRICGILVVANDMWLEYLKSHLPMEKVLGFATPGENRQLSIYNGMLKLKNIMQEHLCGRGEVAAEDMAVFVHDAARPNLSQPLIDRIIDALSGHDGVLPVLPMKDTVYLSEDGKTISSLLERKSVVAGQAPELFDFRKYLAANEALICPEKGSDNPILSINGSTEPAILAGMDIAIVPGEESNYKITTLPDLERFKQERSQ